MGKVSEINIVSAADDNYAQHLGVMLFSLLENATNPRIFKIFIIDGEISELNKENIRNVLKGFKIEPEFIKIDINEFNDLGISHHISRAAYYRIIIPRLLSSRLKKVLYLDSDLIVKKDIEELWNTDLGNNFLAAVEDPLFDRHKILNIPSKYSYFNSGVMLIDIQKWINDNISGEVLKFIRQKKNSILYWDQDGLNGILYSKWKSLSPKWNQQRVFFRIKNVFDTSFNVDEFIGSLADPSIIHYTTSSKPWQYLDDHPFKHEYYRYLFCTPWKSFKPVGRNLLNVIVKTLVRIKRCIKKRCLV